ncbi:MAG: glycosyltransferase family 4 protein [Candidatus Omnitrophica bacterium]|nr:glycosyltransferase family 4 protein [Candidatus Omnitrophota bacterium]
MAEFMFNICNGLDELRNRVYVIAPNSIGAGEFDKRQCFITYRTKDLPKLCDCHKYDILRLIKCVILKIAYSIKIYSSMKQIIQKREIKHIICFHWNTFGIIALILSSKFGIPYYIVAHGLDIRRNKGSVNNRIKWLMQRVVFNNSKGIFVNSNYTKGIILKYVNNYKNICVTYCGVDYKKYIKLFPEPVTEKRDNRTVLLTVTRLVKRKGVDNAIRAFKIVEKSHNSMTYIIAGDGPDCQRLKNLVYEMGLDGKVIFAGHVSENEKINYYNLANIFIMPSREEADGDAEGFGIVYLEANACNLPVIAGDSGGVSDAVSDGYSGLLVDPNDIEDIARKMDLLVSNSNYAAKLGDQGRKRVEEYFNWKEIAKRFDIVLRKCESNMERDHV